MKEFFSYFFGQGETQEFSYLSLAHILPIVFMIGVILLTYKFRNKLKNWKHESKVRMTLAFICIITEMLYFWRLVGVESLNANPVDNLPITVCGWAVIFCSFMTLTKSQTLFDIVYFWVLAGSTFGLLTPTKIMFAGPTRIRYYQFWLEHIMGFIVIFYMIFVHGMRPNFKSMIKSTIAMAILAGIAMMANSMLPGANYLFLADTEDSASILDILPKNQGAKLAVMGVIIIVLFFVVYLPWFIMDIRKKKKALSNPVTILDTSAERQIEPIIIANNESTDVEVSNKTKSKTKSTKNNQNSISKKTTTQSRKSSAKLAIKKPRNIDNLK